MVCKRKNNKSGLHLNLLVFMLFLLPVLNLSAQETKTAIIKLSFETTDSTKICKATVLSDSLPVKEKEVHLYVKRMYSLLPIDKTVTTDENGEASFNFPMDLPGDKNNMVTVIAKIEKDETYGNVEAKQDVKWGVTSTNESYKWNSRSLSASRGKAPMFLVLASIVIIMGIWGTILYLIFQLFVIKKAGGKVKGLTAART